MVAVDFSWAAFLEPLEGGGESNREGSVKSGSNGSGPLVWAREPGLDMTPAVAEHILHAHGVLRFSFSPSAFRLLSTAKPTNNPGGSGGGDGAGSGVPEPLGLPRWGLR